MSLLERCPHFRGWYVQASMELEPEDVSLLERCPHFRGWYVQASIELGPEDVLISEGASLLPPPPLRDVLFTHFESVEEGTRNVVAECVGKLTLVDPHTLLSKLQASH